LTRSELQGNGIVLRTELAASLPPVMADRVQVQQVILNLVINAIEALSAVNAGQRELLVRTASEGSGSVSLAIQDSGQGIAKDKAPRLFNPSPPPKEGGPGRGPKNTPSRGGAHGGPLGGTSAPGRGPVFPFPPPAAKEPLTVPIRTQAVAVKA